MNIKKILFKKLIIPSDYLLRFFLKKIFLEVYSKKRKKMKIDPSKDMCACTICDDDYVSGLIILIESILEFNNWFNLKFYVFMDSDKKINLENQKLLLNIYPNFKFLDLKDEFFEIKYKNQQNIRFSRFSQTYLGLYAFNMIDYKTILSLDTDILCQGNFKHLLSNKNNADIIAVSDAQRSQRSQLFFKSQNQNKEFKSIQSNEKIFQINTGVYVINEKLISKKVYNNLFQLAKEGITNGQELGGDQEVINCYLEKNSNIILSYAPFIYNSSARVFMGINFNRIKSINPIFIHYVGNKPWSKKIFLIGKLRKIRKLWIEYTRKIINERY